MHAVSFAPEIERLSEALTEAIPKIRQWWDEAFGLDVRRKRLTDAIKDINTELDELADKPDVTIKFKWVMGGLKEAGISDAKDLLRNRNKLEDELRELNGSETAESGSPRPKSGRGTVDPAAAAAAAAQSKIEEAAEQRLVDGLKRQLKQIEGHNRSRLEAAIFAHGEHQDVLEAALEKQLITQGTYDELSHKTFQTFQEKKLDIQKDADEKLREEAERNAERMASAGEELFFSAFERNTSSMKDFFISAIDDMARAFVKSQLLKLFGGAFGVGKGAGGLGAGGGVSLQRLSKSLTGFATGGSFTVGGGGGTDSKLVAFRATPGETVDISRPGQKGSAGNVTTINIDATGSTDPAQVEARIRQSTVEMQRVLEDRYARRRGVYA